MIIKPNSAPIFISERFSGPNCPLLEQTPIETNTHDTGNTTAGADALMHWLFVVNGGGSDNVSYQLDVDDRRIVQILRLGRAAYHASDNMGVHGRRGIGIEDCVNRDGNYTRTIGHHVWLLAMLQQAPEIFDWVEDFRTPGIMRGMRGMQETYHQKTAPDHKYCPRQALAKGILPQVFTLANNIVCALPIVQPELAITSRAGDKIIRCSAVTDETHTIDATDGATIVPMNIIRYGSRLAFTTLWGTIIPTNIVRWNYFQLKGDSTKFTPDNVLNLFDRIPNAHRVRARYVLALPEGR